MQRDKRTTKHRKAIWESSFFLNFVVLWSRAGPSRAGDDLVFWIQDSWAGVSLFAAERWLNATHCLNQSISQRISQSNQQSRKPKCFPVCTLISIHIGANNQVSTFCVRNESTNTTIKIRKNLICKLIARSVMCKPHARNINGPTEAVLTPGH